MIKQQLNKIYVMSLLLPIILIAVFLFVGNYTMLYRNHKEMLISDNLRIKSVLFEVTTSVTNLSDYIFDNDSVQTLISTEYGTEELARTALEEFSLIHDLYSQHMEISTINLYTDNVSLVSYEHVQVINQDNQEWFYDAMETPGYYWSTLSTTNQLDIPYQELMLVNPLTINNSDYSALLVVTLSNNYLKNRINNNQLDVDITVNHDPVFYSTWGNENRVINFDDYENETYYTYSGVTDYLGIHTLLEVSTMKPIKTNDKIYIFSNNPNAIPTINNILLVNLLIVGMSILIPLLVFITYTRQFSKRVLTLKNEMHRVTMGDYDIVDTFKGNDELADLFNDLQTMIESIKEKNQAIYEGQLNEQKLTLHSQKMELDLLSSTINPHFLYNTLETIRMKALSSKDKEVADAIKMLGKYMRYNLESTGSTTTLASEINYINLYLNIQKLRFSNRIKHTIHVDESLDLESIKTLPLLIQPIVENAFNHGLSEVTENGEIQVNILDLGDMVQIQVIDNGCGISESQLKSLRDKFSQNQTNEKDSFGLYNIHNRLRLYYGDTFGLEIISAISKGTTIQFEFPKKSLEG